jgi:hypothetical protein
MLAIQIRWRYAANSLEKNGGGFDSSEICAHEPRYAVFMNASYGD